MGMLLSYGVVPKLVHLFENQIEKCPVSGKSSFLRSNNNCFSMRGDIIYRQKYTHTMQRLAIEIINCNILHRNKWVLCFFVKTLIVSSF